ncbi:hypothetical protein SAMN05216312_113209 [Cohnella sp. OV330]|uniref:HPP family protein n=1 Tax=Cohnella sp. OV330 TaxID=1855288 RepID=UPI0008E9687C|nr:HPP family protein [Cohnella sp. OV330]SFB56569.1 hypothetical protein SAMN05216312_113209 [Cohnella sp. OV330]
MNFKAVAICLYIVGIYWLSSRVPAMHALFFPTLGAFSLLFIAHPFSPGKLGKVAFGAVVSVLIGTTLSYVYPGAVSLLVNMLIVIYLINRFKWNAPPILAVSLIPFFVHTSFIWVIPASVCVSLIGLVLTLWIAHHVERIISVQTRSASQAESG